MRSASASSRVEVVLVEHRDVVDIQPDDRLVDARAEAPHVDRRGHARTVVRSVEVGNRLREVFHRPDAAPFDGAAADDRRRDGLRTQHEALFDGRHLHLVHHDHRVGRLRVRRRAVAAAVRAAAAEASSNRGMTSDLRCMYRLRLSGVQSNGFISVGAILIYEEARHIPSGST